MDILPIDGFDECCIYDRAGAGLANGMKVVSMATMGPSVTTMRAKRERERVGTSAVVSFRPRYCLSRSCVSCQLSLNKAAGISGRPLLIYYPSYLEHDVTNETSSVSTLFFFISTYSAARVAKQRAIKCVFILTGTSHIWVMHLYVLPAGPSTAGGKDGRKMSGDIRIRPSSCCVAQLLIIIIQHRDL